MPRRQHTAEWAPGDAHGIFLGRRDQSGSETDDEVGASRVSKFGVCRPNIFWKSLGRRRR